MTGDEAAPGTESSAAHRSQGAHYQVVARRYRPQGFNQLVGQPHIAHGLGNAITTDRVGHAYLFTGARGVGKTSTARIFAKALNCAAGPSLEPCNQCDVCEAVSSGEDIDVLEIDGASNRGIDEIRELRANINIRPSRSRFKIYIIDEVHMLTREAFNALLKTLEEPPSHVKFIFCTTDPDKLPITVLSRCQRFDFAPIAADEIVGQLQKIVAGEQAEADQEALQLIARRAGGSMRDSQSLLEQLLAFAGGKITLAGVNQLLGVASSGRVVSLAGHLADRVAASALAEVDGAIAEGVDVGQLAEQLLTYIRDLMAASVGCPPEAMLQVSGDDYQTLLAQCKQWDIETLLAATQILDHALMRMRQSMHARCLLEAAVVRICCLDSLEEVGEAIQRIATDPSPSSPGPARPPGPGGAPPAARPSAPGKVPATGTTQAGPPAGQQRASTPAQENGPPRQRPPEASSAMGESAVAGAPGFAASPSPDSIGSAPSSSVATPYHSDAPDTHGGAGSAGDPSPVTPGYAPPSTGGAGTATLDRPSDLAGASHVKQSTLTSGEVDSVWKRVLQELGDQATDLSQCEQVAVPGPQRLSLTFSNEFACRYCQRPEALGPLQRALEVVTGEKIKVEFHTKAPSPTAQATPRARPASQAQMCREAMRHELIREAMDIFGAEIVRVDPPSRPKG